MNVSKLNALIDGKKITKASIVKKTGISRPALDSILDGNDFKVSNLEKIARALGVLVGYFFDEDTTEVRQAGRDYVERGKIEHKGPEYNGCSSVEADLRDQIAQLKSQLEDKERIIRLLEGKG
jgi:transcriptional regulator with XRE-family HTH domain